MRARNVTLAAVAAAATAGAAGFFLADAGRRTQLERSARVWRLTTRRGAHWLTIKARGIGADAERRAALDEHFVIKTAEDVAGQLGQMKGAMMKAGQMISFIAEGLPPEAQEALAQLQADVPPMAPSLAEQVVTDELGSHPDELFLDWDPVPIAAASIGQVHKVVLHDGRYAAVKVQYPGVDRAIKGDLDNAEFFYGMFATVALPNLDVKALVDELRDRMIDELDYRIEAECQADFAHRYETHPFIDVPHVIPELSAQRVLTSEWVDGISFAEFEESADDAAKQRAAETVFRFAQGSVHRHRVFNGDPHPGNYRFHLDGAVSFLDFGLVKRWEPGEFEPLSPILDEIIRPDPEAAVEQSIEAGFISPSHGLDPQAIWDYISIPYRPYLEDEFTFTREFLADSIAALTDITGPAQQVIRVMNMPPSYVILDRVVWGVCALMCRLGATNRFRDILNEYRKGGPPVTELGRQEQAWLAANPQ
jgi:predicted unusual protein kinase regulating ubiquinone biosynthesis (AarF/ABC1/UbiB family)